MGAQGDRPSDRRLIVETIAQGIHDHARLLSGRLWVVGHLYSASARYARSGVADIGELMSMSFSMSINSLDRPFCQSRCT